MKRVLLTLCLVFLFSGPVHAQAQRGPQGPQGNPGPAGMSFRQAWNSNVQYLTRDVVLQNGNLYFATAPAIGPSQQPPAAPWVLFLTGGSGGSTFNFRGMWSSGATYAANDVAISQRQLYIATAPASGPFQAPPASPWQLFLPSTSFRSGSGAPSNSLGNDGDLYLDSVTGNLYQRNAGIYSQVANLQGPAGPGTVTSVGVSVPSEFTISPSTITTSGTFTLGKASQSANLLFASPDNAAGPMGARAIVARDLQGAVATTSLAGAVPVLPNDATKYFDGTGHYTVPSNLPPAQDMVGSGPGHAHGLAPDPGAIAGTTRFLREDATYTVPPAGGLAFHGARTADIRDFGATTSADAAPAIQAAYNSLLTSIVSASQNTIRGVLYIPSGTWPMSSPLMADGAFIDVIGERGAVLSCKASGLLSYPIVSGQKRAINWSAGSPMFGDNSGGGQLFPTDMRMDLFGKLDTSHTNVPSKFYGLTSRSPSTTAGANVASRWVQVFASPPATGACDNWKDTRVFTIEFAIENPRGAINVGGNGTSGQDTQTHAILGMGAIGGTVGVSGAQGGPFTIESNTSTFVVRFNTIEGVNGQPRSFSAGNSTLSGVQKLAFQVDFSQNATSGSDTSGLCVIRAYQNGKQVAVTRGQGCRQAAQTFDIGPHATGGSYVYTGVRPDTNVQTSATINFGDSGATVQTRMDSVYGSGNTVVGAYGGGAGGSGAAFRVTFAGGLANANIPAPVFDGTNLTGVTQQPPVGLSAEAGFVAGQFIHLFPNNLAPFWFFGDCLSGQDQFLSSPSALSVLNLYGFQVSNALRYTDVGIGNNEVRVDGLTDNDLHRYLWQDANTICFFNPSDVPDMTVTNSTGKLKTWNGLVRFTLGAAAGAANADTFGWFNHNQANSADNFEPVVDQSYQHLRMESWDRMGGGGIYCHNTFNCRFEDCDFAGGWHGLTLMGGYDYSVRNVIGFGADAFLCAQTVIGKQVGLQRMAIGNVLYRFSGSGWDANDLRIEASNTGAGMPGVVQEGFAQGGTASTITLSSSASIVDNAYLSWTVRIISGTGIGQVRSISSNLGGYVGSTRVATVTVNWSVTPDSTSCYQVIIPQGATESVIRIHPDGTYGWRYFFGGLGTDNELPGQACPLVHASRCSGVVGWPVLRLRDFQTSAQGSFPVLVLDGGQQTGSQANYQTAHVFVEQVQTDGTEVAVDGPGFVVHTYGTQEPLDVEAVRYTGPMGPAFPLRVERIAYPDVWPPVAGRFVAGTIRAMLWNPAAGGLAEVRCTVGGTPTWSSTYQYLLNAYTVYLGNEYQALSAPPVGTLPTNTTYWRPTGLTPSAPIFKGISIAP